MDLSTKSPESAASSIADLAKHVVGIYDSVLMHTAGHKTEAFMLTHAKEYPSNWPRSIPIPPSVNPHHKDILAHREVGTAPPAAPVKTIPIRTNWINYLGGNVRLQGPVEIPEKFLKRIDCVQSMWQQQPDIPLRTLVSQSNAVITGCLRTQSVAALLRPSRLSEITRRTKVEVRRRLGVHNLPNDYLWAPVPYGLGLFDPVQEGARDMLTAIASLNQCPADTWPPIWNAARDGLRAMGQCCRTTIPQDGEWCRTSKFENTLAADTITACTRLHATVTWDCGDCSQRGPLL
eukprot:gene13247-21753_t